MRWLLIGTVALRVAAALVLVAGPWTDEPADLAGWDVARFQELAEEPGRHWVAHEVEYPPGSVVAIEAVAGDSVVETHRTLAALSLAVDLGVAGALAALAGRRAAAVYLILGLPLVPMGLVRFDLWAVAAAVLAVAALAQRRSAAFAALVTAGALVKVWPALLVAAALAVGRRAAALATVAVSAAAGLAWLAYGGWSLDPLDQVLSLRGATGWHVESVGGTLTTLTTDAVPYKQLDAFRIGELNGTAVMVGRALSIGVVAGLVALGWRARTGSVGRDVEIAAAIMLGATAALIVTAPLLSPQFLLWLTPWAALLPFDHGRPPIATWLTGAATSLTGLVLLIYGPPRLAETAPALLLLARNVVLVTVVVAAGSWLVSSGRAEDALGHRGTGPRPAGAHA